MKAMRFKLIFLGFALINMHIYANKKYDVRTDGDSYTYIDTLSVSPDIAYNNAQNWIVKNSDSYKSSVQFDNKEQKKIIAKSGVKFPYSKAVNEESYFLFDLTIELKENRYRIKLDNIMARSILHSVDLGLVSTGEDSIEFGILQFSGYAKDKISGNLIFLDEEEYEKNNMKLQELKDKQKAVKKQKDTKEIQKEIDRLEFWQKDIDERRELYLLVNSTINNYIDLLSKELNVNDDF